MRTHSRAWGPWLVAATLVSIPSMAAAQPSGIPTGLSTDPIETHVTGGEEVEVCGWPDTVAVTGGGGLCTGSLVHPRVVVTAAHCGGGSKTIRFSEVSNAGRSVSAQCTTYPDYIGTNDQAHDWAFCILDEEVTEIPFTPPLFGCELDMLEEGLPVAIAGFGDGGPDGSSGTKRWGMSQVVTTFGNTANIGGDGPSTCQGDSGGSAFVAMADGSWRALSMVSTGLIGCDQTTGVHALMHPAIPWIEETAQIDITPCHDLDGTWNPTPMCADVFAGGSEGYGTWSDWCPDTPRSGALSTCGEPFDAVTDDEPPVVRITSPAYGDTFDSGSLVSVDIDAEDEGWGVREVWVLIGGSKQPVRDEYPPYGFADVPFPDGVFEIVAVAEDWAGNVAMSEPVVIGVNADVPDPEPPSADSSGGAVDTDDPGTTTGDEPPSDDSSGGVPGVADDGGEGGCACNGGGGGLPPVGLLVLLALVRRRRS